MGPIGVELKVGDPWRICSKRPLFAYETRDSLFSIAANQKRIDMTEYQKVRAGIFPGKSNLDLRKMDKVQLEEEECSFLILKRKNRNYRQRATQKEQPKTIFLYLSFFFFSFYHSYGGFQSFIQSFNNNTARFMLCTWSHCPMLCRSLYRWYVKAPCCCSSRQAFFI